ncbi:MAG: tetratricopeptide repeat protein [Pseudomonadota bacterium]
MSATASIACIACVKAFAAAVLSGEAEQGMNALVLAGDASGGLIALLPSILKDSPDKAAKRFLKRVSKDVEAACKASRVNDTGAILKNLDEFGPGIITHNAPDLIARIIISNGGDWRGATALVLGNIPDGAAFDPFREKSAGIERAALKAVLDSLHQLLFAAKSASDELRAAVDAETLKGVQKIRAEMATAKGMEAMEARLLAALSASPSDNADDAEDLRRKLQESTAEVEALQNTIASLLEQAQTDDGAADAVEDVLEGDADALTEYYSGRIAARAQAEAEQAAQNRAKDAKDYVALGNLAFLYNTQTALENYRKATQCDPQSADGWNRLGHILDRLGEIDEALDAYGKVLSISEEAGDRQGMAVAHGNLGNLYRTRGDLGAAEEAYLKGLALNEELGYKEGMARDYGNLGNLYRTRGDLDAAEEAYHKGLAIDEELGRKEGIAIKHGNLGTLYQTRGDLEAAEEAYRKSLVLNEELGRKEGMAIQYGNLGNLYSTRGDLAAAEESYLKSFALNEELGRKEGMARDYGNLGILYETRGDLGAAEEAYLKSLALNEELGRKEGMASDYGNLGALFEKRGQIAEAREAWTKSLALFQQIGMPHRVELIESWLADLPKDD